jgi:hypothetical protein
MTVTTNGQRISRDDLEAAYTRVLGETDATARESSNQLGLAVLAAGVVAVTVAYLLGKRRGRRRSAIVVRRI